MSQYTNEKIEEIIFTKTAEYLNEFAKENKLEVVDVEVLDTNDESGKIDVECNLLINEYFKDYELFNDNEEPCEVSFQVTWSLFTNSIEIDKEENVILFLDFKDRDAYGVGLNSASQSEDEFKEKVGFNSEFINLVENEFTQFPRIKYTKSFKY